MMRDMLQNADPIK